MAGLENRGKGNGVMGEEVDRWKQRVERWEGRRRLKKWRCGRDGRE